MKVLIFHTGSLGDTLVSIPAFRVIREHFGDDHITLLSDVHKSKNYIQARDVLEGSGLVDDYIFYNVDSSSIGKILRPFRMIELILRIRRQGFHTMICLLQSHRNRNAVKRYVEFFKLAGIKRFIGHKGFEELPLKIAGQPIQSVPHQADQILGRLALSGIPTPPAGQGKKELNIGSIERGFVRQWISGLPSDGKRRWIAVGPGSKMPSKVWPAERYVQVVARLIEKHDILPVIFGGSEDQKVGEELIGKWGRGYIAAGRLNIRQGIAAIQNCLMYLGNDTGTLHMAVTAGIPCIGIYSSRDYPENWYPYGDGHIVFRTPIECEGCMLENCIEQKMRCILSIGSDKVYEAADKLLSEKSDND